MDDHGPQVPRRTVTAVKPAGYGVSLLLILFVLVISQLAGEALLGMRHSGEAPGGSAIALLVAGGAALVGLVLVNARWLWATLGNLRFALALMTVWSVSSALGTLVVQRFPNQTDDGYARGFLTATGDFFYNATHVGGGVKVVPEPEVERWIAQQGQLFGADQARELRKQWIGSHTARLRQAEIDVWIREHDALLHDVLGVVSWLRLPEAFQISVWFKALLGLLCTALVIVVIQRWRGEWRQIGWAMAHLGMVVFCVGASVRATMKVDGFLVMHVGKTADVYARKVDPELLGRDPAVQVDPRRGDASRITPLDFEFTLNRFKTEYPRHLYVSFPEQGAEKSWLVDASWKHELMGGALAARVASQRENVTVTRQHRERKDGSPNPALLVGITTNWLERPEDILLTDHEVVLWPPDFGYVAEYRRAKDEAEYERLLADEDEAGGLWAMGADGAAVKAGSVRPGARLPLPGSDLTAVVTAVWPDWAQRGNAATRPEDPAVELDLLRGDAPAGRVAVMGDRVERLDGSSTALELRFVLDPFGTAAPVKYRLLDGPGHALVAITFRAGTAVDTRELRPGDELELGDGGDRLRLQSGFERHAEIWHTAPADLAGMTPDDIYYATLPTETVLELRGAEVEKLAAACHERFGQDKDSGGAAGLVMRPDFDAGNGQLSVTDDGRGLLVRLVSDDRTLRSFPDEAQSLLARALQGAEFPFTLRYVTDEAGQPLRFTSDVSLTRDGKLLKRALVEPNKPLYLAGFQFSQADFRKDDPTYSGFGVVRDPSVRIVYFGMGILVLGVILLFYVNPLVAKRKARTT